MTDDIAGDISKMNYPSNSKKSKGNKDKKEEPKSRLEKVVSGTVIKRKPGFLARVKNALTNDDAHSVGGYILWEVLIPAFQSMVYEAGSQGLERALFGEVRVGSRSPGRNYGSSYQKTPYNKFYNAGPSRNERDVSPRARRMHDFGEIILETRSDAEDALNSLANHIDRYDVATVSDLYEYLGVTSEFIDEQWGWTDARGMGVRHTRGGYMLILPRPEPID